MEQILNELKQALSSAHSSEAIEKLRVEFLGKKGKVAELMKNIKDLPGEEKPAYGQKVNEIKTQCEQCFAEKKEDIKKQETNEKLKKEALDITLPGKRTAIGRMHPLTIVLDEIENIFTAMGFTVAEGPEIEEEYYNFDGLNISTHHPARDEWDSFYIEDGILLRTHTSPVQLRVMKNQKPPLRFIAPGRCYRRDAVDRTHSHTFHQVEGFMVDEDVTMGDLKGVLSLFSKKMFGENVKMRFRPDFFPFTEPSAEGAISCFKCGGGGCPVCSHSGWLEIFGCGMIHPQVLKNVGYDPEQWQGFAFGMGVERIAMLKYGVDDIRLFLENDIRFLKQF